MKHQTLFIGILLICGCGQRSLYPNEYIRWASNPENGLTVTKEIGLFKLDLRYIPSQLLALRDSQGAESETPEEPEKLTDAHSGMLEFQLKLGSVSGSEFLRTGITDMGQYHQRIEYYSAQVQNDVKLVSGTDTLDCVLSHFERTYGVTPYNTLLLAFDGRRPESGDLSLIYDDRVLGIGRTKFTISERTLRNLPKLKL